MTISNLSGRVAALVAAAVVLAVLLLGWFILLAPQRSKISTLDNQIGQTQDQIASTQAYVSSPATKANIAQLGRLKRLLPDDVHMSQILRQLAADAANAGVRLDTITAGPPTAAGGGEAAPVSLTVEGHYRALSKFLHLVRTHARVAKDRVVGKGRLYSVSQIQFTGGGAAGSNGVITAALSLNVFVNAPAGVPVAPTGTTTTPTP